MLKEHYVLESHQRDSIKIFTLLQILLQCYIIISLTFALLQMTKLHKRFIQSSRFIQYSNLANINNQRPLNWTDTLSIAVHLPSTLHQQFIHLLQKWKLKEHLCLCWCVSKSASCDRFHIHARCRNTVNTWKKINKCSSVCL